MCKASGGFLHLPESGSVKFHIVNDEQFALDLLHKEQVLIVHGGGFNWHEPDHFRIVYLPDIRILSDCMDRLEDFLKDYRQ